MEEGYHMNVARNCDKQANREKSSDHGVRSVTPCRRVAKSPEGLQLAASSPVFAYRAALVLSCVAVVTANLAGQMRAADADPFSFFAPVVTITSADRVLIR